MIVPNFTAIIATRERDAVLAAESALDDSPDGSARAASRASAILGYATPSARSRPPATRSPAPC